MKEPRAKAAPALMLAAPPWKVEMLATVEEPVEIVAMVEEPVATVEARVVTVPEVTVVP
jgi:hypothetical protein